MNMVVSQRSSFECTYLVKEGNDYVLNSHNYRVEVSVIGPQQLEDHGFVIEFKTLKKLLDKCLPDHTFLYTNGDRNQELLKLDFESLYVPVLGLPLVCETSRNCRFFCCMEIWKVISILFKIFQFRGN